MSFSILTFLKGFAFWKGEKFGKLLYQVIIVAACLFVFWALFVKRTAVTIDKSNQQAQTIQNIELKEKQETGVFLGLRISGVKIGVQID